MVRALVDKAVQLAQPRRSLYTRFAACNRIKRFSAVQTDGQRWVSKTSILLKEPVDLSKESRQEKIVKWRVQVLV
jgi:hypothetical protein